MMATGTDIPDGTRLAEIPERPVNELFRNHVQSTAFSLSLGRTHVRALACLDRALADDIEESRTLVPEPAMHGLVRRGLVVWLVEDRRRMFRGEDARMARDVWEITAAGKLVLALLVEAGLIAQIRGPLPPPPPGYLDPRPKLRITTAGVEVLPSDREAAR